MWFAHQHAAASYSSTSGGTSNDGRHAARIEGIDQVPAREAHAAAGPNEVGTQFCQLPVQREASQVQTAHLTDQQNPVLSVSGSICWTCDTATTTFWSSARADMCRLIAQLDEGR